MSAHIRAENIGLDLPLYTQNQRGLKVGASILMRAAFSPPKRKFRTTLDGMSFHVNEGDRVALVGRNGAGKSTLMKVLVGAYPLTRGHLEVNGSRQALLNISLGLNNEATLIENIILRGVAMGLKPTQAAKIIDEVLSFAELEEKQGDRLRTLSTGQRMRLGFAIATSVQKEILIMDEWIGTGDTAFVKKAADRLNSRLDDAKIVVLASHNANLLKKVCDRAFFIEAGRLVATGGVEEILEQYAEFLNSLKNNQAAKE